jgi:CRISPR-associated protein Cmr4
VNAWQQVALTSIYTISPTHCGSGEPVGAVDLPIAREPHTGFPVLPASALKGVARDCFEEGDPKRAKDPQVEKLFGSLAQAGIDELKPGGLTFTDARIVAYPARSLGRPFLHVTCPAILEQLRRDLRALNCESLLALKDVPPHAPGRAAVTVSDKALLGKTLVIEDLVYQANELTAPDWTAALAKALSGLLPQTEADTAARLARGLVVLPDEDFSALMRRIPVRARIQLTPGKTTSTWKGEDGKEHSGNLWYEEFLPPECLFLSFVGERRLGQRRLDEVGALDTLMEKPERLAVVQFGGNETVGQGLCLWQLHRAQPAQQAQPAQKGGKR